MLGEFAADGTGLLWPKIQRLILLVLVRFPQRCLLLLRNDSQNPSNRQPHHLAA
jgi:hypothetical protein